MQHRRISRRKAGNSDHGAAWISYSDMMAALLLIFVMVLVYSIYQYFVMMDLKTKEINEKELQLIAQQGTLDEQESTLNNQKLQLDEQSLSLAEKERLLSEAQLQLKDQQDSLNTKTQELEHQNSLLLSAQNDLKNRENELATANNLLNTQKEQMATQQKKLDELIGIRTQIIKELSDIFSKQNLKASVDKKTGDIVLESAVFFDTAKYEIKQSGQDLLTKFLPAYFSVLMRDKYKEYLGEIIIEGHTDTAGDYFMNLELSQQRALAVAKFCLEMPSLSKEQRDYLREVLTAKGRSYSSPILKADGSVDMEKSRRVEFKFRLKDSEMIYEINKILNQN